MKKILIALLSLAMLFSFIACDNSNSNAPADEGDQVTVVDSTILAAMEQVKTAMMTGDGSISKLLGVGETNALEVAGQTASATGAHYTTLEVSRTLAEAGEATAAKTVKLVANGIDTSVTSDDGLALGSAYDIAFNTYIYTYTGNVLNAQGENVPFTATVNGFFGDSVTATAYTDSTTKKLVYAVAAPSIAVILPQTSAGITLTIGGEDVTDRIGYAFDQLLENTTATKYADYVKAQDGTFGNSLDDYAIQLLDQTNTSGSLVSTIAGWLTADPTTGGSPVLNTGWTHSYASGTATFKFSPVNDLEISKKTSPDDGDVQIKVARNSEITVTFSTAETVSGNFNPETYTISGDFIAYAYSADDSAYATTGQKFHVELAGDVETATGSDAMQIVLDGETGIKSIDLKDSTFEKAGSVSGTFAKGPNLVESARTEDQGGGNAAVLENGEVSIEYPYTRY